MKIRFIFLIVWTLLVSFLSLMIGVTYAASRFSKSAIEAGVGEYYFPLKDNPSASFRWKK